MADRGIERGDNEERPAKDCDLEWFHRYYNSTTGIVIPPRE